MAGSLFFAPPPRAQASRVIAVPGDSITANPPTGGFVFACVGGSALIPAPLTSLPFATVHSTAQSGQTLRHDQGVQTGNNGGNNVYDRTPGDDAALSSGVARVYSIFIGANDLPSTAWLTEYAAHLDARRKAGWFVILCTLLPQDITNRPGWSTFLALRAVANPELRSWTTGGSICPGIHADMICDFAADPAMGQDGQENSIYINSLHPYGLGHQRMKDIYLPVIDAALRNDYRAPTIKTTSYTSEAGGPDTVIQLLADRGVTWKLTGASGLAMKELSQLQLTSNTAGTYTGMLTATDGLGRSTSMPFTWTVTAPPNLYGPNLILNPSANNLQIGWTPLTLWFQESSSYTAIDDATFSASPTTPITVVSNGAGGNAFRITGDGAVNIPSKTQTFTGLIPTKTYRLFGKARKGTATNASIQVNNNGTITTYAAPSTSFTELGPQDIVASATSMTVSLMINLSAATGTAEFYDIFLRQLL